MEFSQCGCELFKHTLENNVFVTLFRYSEFRLLFCPDQSQAPYGMSVLKPFLSTFHRQA